MHIEWNTVTWYSKALALVLIPVVFALGLYLGTEFKVAEAPRDVPDVTPPPIETPQDDGEVVEPTPPAPPTLPTSDACTCPSGYRKDGNACNPECYYGTPACLAPSIPCGKQDTSYTPVACTLEAKQCSDGSYVGRTGPNCEFAPCPTAPSPTSVTCTDDMKRTEACTMEYAPVCGLVQIECITTPCNPVPETFGNGCTACAAGNVLSYTPGACAIDD